MNVGDKLTLKTLAGDSYTGLVKDPGARIGVVAQTIAAKAHLAGGFELVDRNGLTLDPTSRLADLPVSEEEETVEITLAPDLTPALEG